MEENPYQAPLTTGGPPQSSESVEFRVFTGKSFSLRFSKESYRNKIRDEAQQAIADEIGAENLIAVTEHVEAFGSFSVVVWYRVSNW